MKKIATLLIVMSLGVLFAASTCFAQMYTVLDLGTLGGTTSMAAGLNASGQVAGTAYPPGNIAYHAFRTAANSPINGVTDDLGTLGGGTSQAYAINDSGQVVGISRLSSSSNIDHAFRTAPNSPINAATDDLGDLGALGGTLGGTYSWARAINNAGQVAGYSFISYDHTDAFRTAANMPINPATDALGPETWAYGINASGQVVGMFSIIYDYSGPAFRTAPNSRVNPATDSLGTLGGSWSFAYAINDSGQVVGISSLNFSSNNYHAFRTAPNSPINPATDDLGTLGWQSSAWALDSWGQVVGDSSLSSNQWWVTHAFLYSNALMQDLNELIPNGSGWLLQSAVGINDKGQIVGNGTHDGYERAFLLTPIYMAFVQPPLNAHGTSIFPAKKGVVPVKFTLTQNDAPTCTLPAATIAVARTAGGTLGSIGESTYSTPADTGSNFRIDLTDCQYVYNLAASSLGVGTYRVDISINGIFVGHAVFALQ